MEITEEKLPGIIDTLSSGFALVMHHPWVLLVPIALDLFLWLGPQAHAKPVFDEMIRLVAASAAQNPTPDTQATVDALQQALQAAGEQFNIFSYVALFGILSGLPVLTGLTPPSGLEPAVAFSIADSAALLGWIALCALVGALLSSVYLEWIARRIRKEADSAAVFLIRVLQDYARLVWLGIAVGIGAVLLSLPFLLGAVLVSVLSPVIGMLFLMIVWLFFVWAALYLVFAVPAIFISRSGPFQAILNSIVVFRYNFWSATALVFLVILIEVGFSVIWQRFMGDTVGEIAAVIASAFLGTGLIAAAMLFYYDRFEWLTRVREQIHRQQQLARKG